MKNKYTHSSDMESTLKNIEKPLKKRLILTVEMDRRDLLRLRKHAKSHDRSVSSLIRSMIKQYLVDSV